MPYPRKCDRRRSRSGRRDSRALLLLHDIADVVMIDVAEGLPQGKALDMMHMRSVEKFGPTVSAPTTTPIPQAPMWSS